MLARHIFAGMNVNIAHAGKGQTIIRILSIKLTRGNPELTERHDETRGLIKRQLLAIDSLRGRKYGFDGFQRASLRTVVALPCCVGMVVISSMHTWRGCSSMN